MLCATRSYTESQKGGWVLGAGTGAVDWAGRYHLHIPTKNSKRWLGGRKKPSFDIRPAASLPHEPLVGAGSIVITSSAAPLRP